MAATEGGFEFVESGEDIESIAEEVLRNKEERLGGYVRVITHTTVSHGDFYAGRKCSLGMANVNGVSPKFCVLLNVFLGSTKVI